MPEIEKVRFIDASHWDTQYWLSSGGTRAKRILQDSYEKLWFFKCSEKKPARENLPEKYYRYEFWSEIIASQLGLAADLNILRYDAAIHNSEIGCISPNMIVTEEEQLVEMGRYMTAVNPDFLPENSKTRQEYTYQLLETTLAEFELEEYRSTFFQTLIFDALIGNTDRHQENWALIAYSSFTSIPYDKLIDLLPKLVPYADKEILRKLSLHDLNKLTLKTTPIKSVAPIYDNGSSLGRELVDDRVILLINDDTALKRYVEFGRCELHLHGHKLSHFQILENLLNSKCASDLKKAANFLGKIDEPLISKVLGDIDCTLPDSWVHYCIPDQRKSLIIKLVTLRLQKLKELFNVRF